MLEVGRICVKTAGRDSNKYCIVIEKIDDNFVVVEGETRRRKVNIKHLEPTKKKVEIKKNPTKEECIELIKKAGFEVKTKEDFRKKKKTEKPEKRSKKAAPKKKTKK